MNENLILCEVIFMAIITISRQVAAHGDEVASELSKLTGYKFFTRKEIEKKIVELGFPEAKMPKFDERKPGFFASLTKDRDEYFNYTQYAILEAAAQQNVIIIGRGAFALLQNVPNVISVRLVADEKTRIGRLQEEFNWDEKQALQRIQESDTNRTGFHNSFYNIDVNDNSLYHAVINTGKISIENSAKIIHEVVKAQITPELEKAGEKTITDLLKAQKIVNQLYFEKKVDIDFMHASIEENIIILHGVSNSPAVVEQALQIIRAEMPEYEAKSAVSIVHDFKTFQ